jgi:hypothetical protein
MTPRLLLWFVVQSATGIYAVDAMKRRLTFVVIFASFVLARGASATSVPLHVNTYDFPIAGGGGGEQATLDGAQVEMYGDDFLNSITVNQDYSANETQLSTSADLSQTRFGGVASNAWTTIALTGTKAATYQSFFNNGAGTAALARYEMIAYLISEYNLGQGKNSASNKQIQNAIWLLMDPSNQGAPPNAATVNSTSYLEGAADWYTSMNTLDNLDALNAMLADFVIVSPSSGMTVRNGVYSGGFQEQIAILPTSNAQSFGAQDLVLTPTPEPRSVSFILFGLLGAVGLWLQRLRRTKVLA